MIARSTRGIMANIKAGLFFKFQFNPSEMETDKKVNYDFYAPPGWDRPIARYKGNGESTIEFELWGDSTAGSAGIEAFTLPRPFGVRDVISVLESFKLPEQKPFELPRFYGRRFVAPPDCYFIYGMRWARCKLIDAPIKEMLYDAFTLNPNRFHTKIKLAVIEEGSLYEYASVQRAIMARLASASGALSSLTSLNGLV